MVYIACLQTQPRKAAQSVRSVRRQSQNIDVQLVQSGSKLTSLLSMRRSSSAVLLPAIKSTRVSKDVCVVWYPRADMLENDCSAVKAIATEAPAPLLSAAEDPPVTSEAQTVNIAGEKEVAPLKPLTEISWPPEPDASVFTDPLKRDDPKPLRREELMRIGKQVPVDVAELAD